MCRQASWQQAVHRGGCAQNGSQTVCVPAKGFVWWTLPQTIKLNVFMSGYWAQKESLFSWSTFFLNQHFNHHLGTRHSSAQRISYQETRYSFSSGGWCFSWYFRKGPWGTHSDVGCSLWGNKGAWVRISRWHPWIHAEAPFRFGPRWERSFCSTNQRSFE